MAHSATLSGLAAALVTSVTGLQLSDDARKFRRAREAALRGLRVPKFARTNQFDVQRSCDGFVEKFIVLNRDDLADALDARFKELSNVSNKWTPEILSLLLLLSDDAVEKARVEDLEKLRPPSPPPQLTWADIVRDDPLDEEGIWDDIDYAAESSEDEKPVKNQRRAETRESTPPSSVHEEDEEVYQLEALIEPINTEILKSTSEAQFWREPAGDQSGREKIHITELQALRETLFMLAGLDTSLFKLSKASGRSQYVSKYSISHAMGPTFAHQMHEFSAIGLKVQRLRIWARQPQSIGLLQTFQDAVVHEIRDFDKYLASIQQKYLGGQTVQVSLMEVHACVQKRAQPLFSLESLISETAPSIHATPFAYLEALYERVNLAQAANDAELFAITGRIFFLCLRTYLKPIRQWMEQGELGHDDNIFFVALADKSNEASSLWHDRYVLRQDPSGQLHAPSFLQPAANKMFNSGKSVVFLKELRRFTSTVSAGAGPEPALNFTSICGANATADPTAISIPLAPFSELFALAFDTWIRSKYTFASLILRQEIYSRCGLWRCLDALENLYFTRDGSLAQTFAAAVFDKLDADAGRATWNDRFVLTEVARGTFGALECVDVDKLVVRTTTASTTAAAASQENENDGVITALASIAFDYALPWPIANIVVRASLHTYQRVHALLLQTHRAAAILKAAFLLHGKKHGRNGISESNTEPAHALRHRLTHYTTLITAYLTSGVLEPATAELRTQLAKSEDVDAMAAAHRAFVEALERRCFLERRLRPVLGALVGGLGVVGRFGVCLGVAGDGGNRLRGKQRVGLGERGGRGRGSQRGGRVGQRGRPRGRGRADWDGVEDDDGDDGGDSSSSSSSSDTEDTEDLADVASTPPHPTDTIPSLHAEFDKQYKFLTAGLKGVSRAGGERCWEMLAERLEGDVPGPGGSG